MAKEIIMVQTASGEYAPAKRARRRKSHASARQHHDDDFAVWSEAFCRWLAVISTLAVGAITYFAG